MKLRLDALGKWDCEVVREWRNAEPQFLRTPYKLTKEMQEGFYDNVVCNRNSNHRYFAIRDEFSFVGMGGLTNIEWENGCCEISLILDPKSRGKGYGGRSVDLLLDYAFGSLRMENVYGEVYACGNHEFWKHVVEVKNGYWTTLRGRKFFDGKMWDSYWFSIGREKWSA